MGQVVICFKSIKEMKRGFNESDVNRKCSFSPIKAKCKIKSISEKINQNYINEMRILLAGIS